MHCKYLVGVDLAGHLVKCFLGALEKSSSQDSELEVKGAVTQSFQRNMENLGSLKELCSHTNLKAG